MTSTVQSTSLTHKLTCHINLNIIIVFENCAQMLPETAVKANVMEGMLIQPAVCSIVSVAVQLNG